LMKGPASCNTTTSSIQRKPANIEILCPIRQQTNRWQGDSAL
jgi:hypothetical protein